MPAGIKSAISSAISASASARSESSVTVGKRRNSASHRLISRASVLIAHSADHQHALLTQAYREEAEQQPGGFVGPVQVLQHEHERSVCRQLGQQREHSLEQPVPGHEHVAGVVRPEQPAGLVGQRSQERPVRQRRAGQRRTVSEPPLRAGTVGGPVESQMLGESSLPAWSCRCRPPR